MEKAFRPISLTFSLLKDIERIVDNILKIKMSNERLSVRQHAYIKGRSVKTTIHADNHT